MFHTRLMSIALPVCLFIGLSCAPKNAGIQGVWQALSQKVDGNEMLTSGKYMAVITATHFVGIYQDKEKGLALLARKTQRDSLTAYFAAFAAGGGTYKLAGNTFTETFEYFPDPNYIGITLEVNVKIEGNRLYQSGKYPILQDGKKVKDVQLDEVYERVE